MSARSIATALGWLKWDWLPCDRSGHGTGLCKTPAQMFGEPMHNGPVAGA